MEQLAVRLSVLYRTPERELADQLNEKDVLRLAAYDRDYGLPDAWLVSGVELLRWIANCLGLTKYKLPNERKPQTREQIVGVFQAAMKAAEGHGATKA